MKISRYTYHKLKRDMELIRPTLFSLLLVELIIITGIIIASKMIGV